jgi:hypothetical protein
VANIDDLLSLAHSHRKALAWFQDRAGTEIAWPQPLDGLHLVNKAKGIRKPAGWQHVLSIRQTLKSPYADKNIVELPNGDWTYEYYQEGAEESSDPYRYRMTIDDGKLLRLHTICVAGIQMLGRS